jgi:hypothetical protein
MVKVLLRGISDSYEKSLLLFRIYKIEDILPALKEQVKFTL